MRLPPQFLRGEKHLLRITIFYQKSYNNNITDQTQNQEITPKKYRNFLRYM